MPKNWKFSFYLFFFGLLTLVAVLFKNQVNREYSPSEVLGTATNVSLFVEPEDGRKPLLEVLNLAQKEILAEAYLLSDPDVKLYLEEADRRGADVRVILEQHPFGGGNINNDSKTELENNGVLVRWSSPDFALTHEKTVIVDGKIVCILNMNLTKTAFTKNREYNACDENPAEVSEAKRIFLADWDRKDYSPIEANLVVSPNNSRGKLVALIKAAEKSLDVEMEVLEDDQIINLLAERSGQIPVRIILPPISKVDTNQKAVDGLRAAGTKVRVLSSPYIHAKVIVVDGQRVYLGSVNLSSQSLDQNRELGILISRPDVVSRIAQTFEKDWDMAQ